MFVQLTKDYFGQKAGARVDVDEPVARSLLEQGAAEAVHGARPGPVVARSRESLLTGLTSSLNATIDATLREFAAARTRSRKTAVPAIFGEGHGGDPRRTFGNFL